MPARPRRWPYLVAAIVLLVGASAAIAVSGHTSPNRISGTAGLSDLGPAPALVGGGDWINSAPLTPRDLRGKVIVYDFWTYSCVNCVRTIPYLRSWYDRYRGDGLVIVGVHSPEFQFEHDLGNVRRAVTELHVDYPVVQDNQLAIWSAFKNNYWPADYLADRTGRLRSMHIGEGDYANTENLLRELLQVTKTSPRATSPHLPREGNPPTETDNVTLETYLGTDRGATNANPGTATYPTSDALDLHDGEAAVTGTWTATPQYLRSGSAGASIVLRYDAREVNLVMATDNGKPVVVEVLVDGRPLVAADRTAETVVEPGGRTVVRVSASDLYRIVLGPAIESHTVTLVARSAGLRAYAFTFGA
jgi:thiol-disulfide isomerase/thioredoxin